jgi:hypothetical protein
MWLAMLVAMVGNGFLRVLVLEPRLGEARARRAASLAGVCIVLVLSAAFVRSLHAPGTRRLLGVGLLWLVLTVAFECAMGRYVSGLSWSQLFADYDLSKGRLWPLVLAAILAGPWLTDRVIRTRSSRG